MKQTIKTSRTAGYLEKIFRKCNEHYFNGELVEPIITIAPTKGAYGHCTVNEVWTKSTGETAYEINIASGNLDRPIEDIVATLLHEMVHLWNLTHGVQDTSRGYTYHNTKFKSLAEKCDLQIDHHPTYGWTITTPTDKLVEFCIDNGWSEIAMSRPESYGINFGGRGGNTSGGSTPTGVPTPKKNSWKWVCPNCGMIVRSTKDLTGKIACVDCIATMIEA